jgi:small lipoprotein (TIGR04452 family)
MKKIKIIAVALIIAATASSCTNIGLLGQGGIVGSKVKADLTSIAKINNLLTGNAIFIVIDDTMVPSLAGISDTDHYTKTSVDACKSKMSTVGLVVDNWVGAISCSLKKVPPIIQIGDSGI